MFEEVDSRVSSCWRVGFRRKASASDVSIAFEEWLSDEMFYERLIDGNDREVEVFQRYKRLLTWSIHRRPLRTKPN